MHEAALRGDEDPDRLSLLHTVRVIRRKLPQIAALSPSGSACLASCGTGQILEECVERSRGRAVPRGVRRKMSNYRLRRLVRQIRLPWPNTVITIRGDRWGGRPQRH